MIEKWRKQKQSSLYTLALSHVDINELVTYFLLYFFK